MADSDEAAARAKSARIKALSDRYLQLKFKMASAWGSNETIALMSEFRRIIEELKSLGITEVNGLPIE